MKRFAIALVLATSMGAWGAANAEEGVVEKLELKEGGILFMHPDGTSRMVDGHGKKIDMSDGIEMELKDGRVIMMKNKKVWMRHGPPGKGHEGMMND